MLPASTESVAALPGGPGRVRPRRLRGALVVRLLAYAVGAASMAQLLRTIDLSEATAVVAGAGPAVALALAPLGLQILLEAVSWRALLSRLGRTVRQGAALRVSLVGEGVRLAFPGGAAAGDAARTALFRVEAGVPVPDGAAALAIRKLCHLATQGVYLALGAALGTALFAAAGSPRALRAGTLSTAFALTAAAAALSLALFHGRVASRMERLLSRLTRGRFAAALEARRSSYAALDERLRTLLGRHGGTLAWNLVTALAGWLLEAAEAWLLLLLLGVPIAPGEAIALEALVSVARSAAFAVPGGLGVQDLGYHALLRGLVGEPAAAAFVLMRRARDLSWIAIAFLSRLTRSPPLVSPLGHPRNQCDGSRPS